MEGCEGCLDCRKVAQCKVDSASTPVVRDIVLWTDDKQNDERNSVFRGLGRRLRKCAVVFDCNNNWLDMDYWTAINTYFLDLPSSSSRQWNHP